MGKKKKEKWVIEKITKEKMLNILHKRVDDTKSNIALLEMIVEIHKKQNEIIDELNMIKEVINDGEKSKWL